MPQLPRDIAVVDFETFFCSKTYTLKKLTTTAYVRHAQFKVHGAAIRRPRARKSRWHTGNRVARELRSIDWSRTALLCQNSYFDGLILSEHYDIHPCFILDTMSMGRGLFRDQLETRADLNSLAKALGVGAKHETYLDAVDGVRDPPAKDLKVLGDGAIIDADLTYDLFQLIMLEHEFPEEELNVIHHTVRCFTEPLLQVDKEKAWKSHKRVVNQRKRLLRKVWRRAHPDAKRFTQAEFKKLSTTLRSRKQFPELLRAEGVEPPLKISKAWSDKPRAYREANPEKKFTYAFAKNDLAFQTLTRHPNPVVAEACKAKLLVNSSIYATRPLRMIEHADPALTIMLGMYNAHTLRWGGGDKMNPQNLGKDGELRSAIMAPSGHKLVVVDAKQIEARFLGWLAGQWDLLEQFIEYDKGDDSADPYCIMASAIFGRPITKADELERFIGKTSVLGMGYQMSAGKYQLQLESGALGKAVVLEPEIYQKAVDTYRGNNPAIQQLWWDMGDRIPKMIQPGYYEDVRGCLEFMQRVVWQPCGLGLHYPRLREARIEELGAEDEERAKTHPFRKQYIYRDHSRLYGGKLVENLVQALCRQIVAEQIMRIADTYRVVMMVHDEVVLCVPNRLASRALAETIESFGIPCDWCPDLPVGGEGAIVEAYAKL